MIENKANVGVFDRDASMRGGYVYTDRGRLSSRLANKRISEAIVASVDMRGKSVVDLGCGDGVVTVDFARAGAAHVLGHRSCSCGRS